MCAFLRPDELTSWRAAVTARFDTTCTIQRLSGTTYTPLLPSTTCLIFAGTGTVTYPGLPSMLALQEWVITLPYNSPVQVGDRIVTALATYQVQRMDQPSSYNVNTVAHCYQLFDAAGNAVYLVPNAVVNTTRAGTPIYTNRSVQLTTPAMDVPALPGADTLREMGPLLQKSLMDVPDSTAGRGWAPGDRVTVVSEGGIPHPNGALSWGVYTVEDRPSPFGPALIDCRVIGLPTYPSSWPTPVTISRNVFNSGTKQTTPTQEATLQYVYLRDLANEFTERGMALEFRYRLVCDGVVDLRDGDLLTGLPAVATERPYRTFTAQHVATHVLAGWSYKTAFVKAQQ